MEGRGFLCNTWVKLEMWISVFSGKVGIAVLTQAILINILFPNYLINKDCL